MVLKMKNFNILGGSLKKPTFKGGEGVTKNQYRGGRRLPKKGGLDCLLI